MNKFRIILILTIGLFLIPSIGLACGKESGKHSCVKEISHTENQKIHSHNHSGCTDNDGEGCSGKCGRPSCRCPLTCSPVFLLLQQQDEFPDSILFFFIEKQQIYTSDTEILSGFYSIWLIPKIS